MIDATTTLLAYMLGHGAGLVDRLQLHARFSDAKTQNTCMQQAQSPFLKWSGVPPEASSLALIIKDEKLSKKRHYEWVVYNLPAETKYLPLDTNDQINPRDEGVNTWGQKNYHAPCWKSAAHPVVIELFALDKRFSAKYKMTGEVLEQKMKGHVLAKAIGIVPSRKFPPL